MLLAHRIARSDPFSGSQAVCLSWRRLSSLARVLGEDVRNMEKCFMNMGCLVAAGISKSASKPNIVANADRSHPAVLGGTRPQCCAMGTWLRLSLTRGKRGATSTTIVRSLDETGVVAEPNEVLFGRFRLFWYDVSYRPNSAALGKATRRVLR